MTVAELRSIMNALPADCDELPILLDVDRRFVSACVVLIDPPGNWAGTAPCVTITSMPDLLPADGLPAMTLPRHS